MENLILPKQYKSELNLHDTQLAIKTVKDFFQALLAQRLHLTRQLLFLRMRSFACVICSVTEREGAVAKSPLPPALQKIQPRESSVPSRFGQVIPPFKDRR